MQNSSQFVGFFSNPEVIHSAVTPFRSCNLRVNNCIQFTKGSAKWQVEKLCVMNTKAWVVKGVTFALRSVKAQQDPAAAQHGFLLRFAVQIFQRSPSSAIDSLTTNPEWCSAFHALFVIAVWLHCCTVTLFSFHLWCIKIFSETSILINFISSINNITFIFH